ncbi:MAG: LysR family transcriptional regulator, partial [Rhodoferax sp.]|nr:LysR family transcriptional regulator [Rhodoferax sp.]
MEWSDLRVFLAIAREGTLRGAARQLGQSQPTMGRRLRALEQSTGQTLFQRTGEGFVLTDEGAAILPHAERMEDEALGLQRRLAGQDEQLEGLLRLSSSDWFGTHLLAPVLAEFAQLQPRVAVELLTSAAHFSLPRREADLVFRIRPFDEPEVVSRKLMHIDYGVYLKAGLPPPLPGDGAGTPLVTMDTAFSGMPDAVWLQKMLPRAFVVSRSNNRDVQARLC